MTAPRQFKNAAYERLADLGKVLASGPRLELIELLCQGPRTVDALAELAGQSLANTSRHLQVLRRARLVDATRRGTHVSYRLADPHVAAFFGVFRRVAEQRVLELEQLTRDFLEARGALEPIDADTLVERVRAGAVTVIDVRPRDEFDAGHLPGALSIPIDQLEHRLAELPRDRDVVAYCRGPYCVMAIDAVERLRAHGLTAHRLELGIADWRARGLDVTSDPETDR